MLQKSILQYFGSAISYHLSLRPLFCIFLSGRFRHVFPVVINLLFYQIVWGFVDFLVFQNMLCVGLCVLSTLAIISLRKTDIVAQCFVFVQVYVNCSSTMFIHMFCVFFLLVPYVVVDFLFIVTPIVGVFFVNCYSPCGSL